MHKSLFIMLFITACFPLFAQEGQFVRVQLKNKTVVTGDFEGVRNGKYIISVGGSVKEIPDSDVVDVEFDTKPPEKTPPVVEGQNVQEVVPQVDIGQINKSLESIEKAITYVNDILVNYSKKQEEVYKNIAVSKESFKNVFITTHKEYVNRLIFNEQSNKLSDEIRRVSSLPAEYNPVLEHIITQAEGLAKRSPQGDFTIGFVKSLALTVYTSQLATDEQKKRISDTLNGLIDELKDVEADKAISLLEVKVKIQPKEAENIKAEEDKIHANAEKKWITMLCSQVNGLITEHKFTEARTLLTEIFSKYPDNKEAEVLSKLLEQEKLSLKYSLIKTLIDVGKFDQAKDELNKILQTEPNDATAKGFMDNIKKKELDKKCELIKAYIDGHNFDQAQAMLNESLITFKDEQSLLELEKYLNNKELDVVNGFVTNGELDQAKKALGKILVARPDDPIALEMKNKIRDMELDKKCQTIKMLIEGNNFDQAKTLIKESLATFGSNPSLLQLEQLAQSKVRDANINTVESFIKDCDFSRARSELKRLLALEPDNPTFLKLEQTLKDKELEVNISSAKTFIEQGNFEKAKALAKELSRVYPDEEKVIELENTINQKELSYNITKIDELISNGKLDQANAELDKLLSKMPNDPSFIQTAEKLRFEIASSAYKSSNTIDSKIKVLNDLLNKAQNPEYRKWAEAELASLKESKDKKLYQPQTKIPVTLDQKSYFPVKEGLWHKYRLGRSNFIEKIKLENVNSTKNEDGTEFFELLYSVQRQFKSYATSANFEMRLDANSLTRVGVDEEEVLMKFPVKEGEIWSWEDERAKYTRKYVATNAEVNTTGGKFSNCLVTEFTSSMTSLLGSEPITLVSREYYAPGVGLVKIDFPNKEYADQSRELIDWGIDKPNLAEEPQSPISQAIGHTEIKQEQQKQAPMPPPYNTQQSQNEKVKTEEQKQKDKLIEKHRSWF